MRNLELNCVIELDKGEQALINAGMEVIQVGNNYYEVWWYEGKRYARLISSIP